LFYLEFSLEILNDLPDDVMVSNNGNENDLSNGNDLMNLEPSFNSNINSNDGLIQQNGPTSLPTSLSKGGTGIAGNDPMNTTKTIGMRSPRPNVNMAQNCPPQGPISTAGMPTPPTPMLNAMRNTQLSVGNMPAGNSTSNSNTSMNNSSNFINRSSMSNNSAGQFNNNTNPMASMVNNNNNNAGTFNSPMSMASSNISSFNPSASSMAYSGNFNQSLSSSMVTSNSFNSNPMNNISNMNNNPNVMISNSNSMFNGQQMNMSSAMNVMGQNMPPMIGNRNQNFNGNPGGNFAFQHRMFNNLRYGIGPKTMGNFPMNLNNMMDVPQDGGIMNMQNNPAMSMNRMVSV